jgi:hypothetical protein
LDGAGGAPAADGAAGPGAAGALEVDPGDVPGVGADGFADDSPPRWPDVPDERRSTFAQPVPLKRMVGGAKARRTVSWQSGHW